MNAQRTPVSHQQFWPWGEARDSNVTQTTLNYTGQHLDSTGLLYYNARYYDPVLARFISADSMVPSAALGTGGALGTLGPASDQSHRTLTVDYHEPGFVTAVNGENASGGATDAPVDPQALNRYSYAINNPVRFDDPTGHIVHWTTTNNVVVRPRYGSNPNLPSYHQPVSYDQVGKETTYHYVASSKDLANIGNQFMKGAVDEALNGLPAGLGIGLIAVVASVTAGTLAAGPAGALAGAIEGLEAGATIGFVAALILGLNAIERFAVGSWLANWANDGNHLEFDLTVSTDANGKETSSVSNQTGYHTSADYATGADQDYGDDSRPHAH